MNRSHETVLRAAESDRTPDRILAGGVRPHSSADGPLAIRVGLDLVSVSSVAETLDGPDGERYLRRVYTEQEVRDCVRGGAIRPERLALRFAAKEAALKALPVDGQGLSPRTLEVRTGDAGRVYLHLTGLAAELAATAGVVELALSAACSRDYATAVVVASYLERDGPADR